MKIQTLLGINVKKIREAKNWSQDTLSDKSGLHRTYISGIERGVRNPTVGIIELLANALEVHISTLFNDPKKEDS